MNDFNGTTKEKRKVAIYIRVSTSEQKIDGYSLEAQKKRLQDYINNNPGLNFITEPTWIFEDVHTGSELARKGLQTLIEQVQKKKFDAVLVWKIDRLSRSLKHLLTIFENFEKNDVSFISVQENIDFKGPIGKLIFQIFGAIAQFERELIKGRTKMGIITSAEMGNYTGSAIPYGYKPVQNPNGRGKKLQIILEEKKWVQEVFNWYIFDELGLGQITDKLNKLKVPTSRYCKAIKWSERMVRTMIHSHIYRGAYIANKKDDVGNLLPEADWTTLVIPACVSELTFNQAQNVLHDRKSSKAHTDYLLSGKLRDISLEKPKAFVGCKRTKGGYSYRRKQFKKDTIHYPTFEVPAKPIEDYVWGKVLEALKDPKTFIKYYLSKEYSDPTRIQKLENQLSNLRQREVKVELELARIEAGYDRGVYDEDKAKYKIAEKNRELVEIQMTKQKIEDELNFISSVDIEVQKLKEASAQVKYRLDNLNARQRKTLVNLFVDKVEMHRVKEGKKWNITAEVFFRFNPSKFPNDLTRGRTGSSLKTKENTKNNASQDVTGAACRI